MDEGPRRSDRLRDKQVVGQGATTTTKEYPTLDMEQARNYLEQAGNKNSTSESPHSSSVQNGQSSRKSTTSVSSSTTVQKMKSGLKYEEQLASIQDQIEELNLEIDILRVDLSLYEQQMVPKKQMMELLPPGDEERQNKLVEEIQDLQQQISTANLSIRKHEVKINSLKRKMDLLKSAKELELAEIEEQEDLHSLENVDLDNQASKSQLVETWTEKAAQQQLEAQQRKEEENAEMLKLEVESETARRKFEEFKNKIQSEGETGSKVQSPPSPPPPGNNSPTAADPLMQVLLVQSQALQQIMQKAESTPNTSEKFIARQSHNRDLPFFSGRPEEWPQFISDYKRTTEVCSFTDAENVSRLRKCLKGEAAKAVQCLMVSPDNLNEVMEILETRFGQTKHVVEAMINKAKQTPSVKVDRPETIIEFGTAVTNMTSTIKALGCSEHLCNPLLLSELESKLPYAMKAQWSRWKSEDANRKKDLETFTTWMKIETRVACEFHVPIGKDSEAERKRDFRKPQAVFAVTDNTPDTTKTKSSFCNYCETTGHWTSNCPKLKSFSVDDRRKVVKEKNWCFSCLIPGHRVNDCKRSRSCGLGGCKDLHNRLLHLDKNNGSQNGFKQKRLAAPGKKETYDDKPKEVSSTPSDQETLQTDVDGFPVYATGKKEDQETIMKIIKVKVAGPLGAETIFALIDSGSRISIMEDGLAHQLGIQGKLSPFCMTTLTSYESHDDSRKVELEIIGTHEDAQQYQMKDVRTVSKLNIKSVSQDTNKIVRRWPKLKDSKCPSFNNKRIRMLIGNSHCFLTTPLEHIGDSIDEPMAFKSRLGWCFGGPQRAKSGEIEEHSVFHLCDAELKDEYLHQLIKKSFTTEEFGVSVKHDKPRSKEDERALVLMENTTKRPQGTVRFETGLLWRNEDFKFPESKSNALNRLRCQERKMDKDPVFAQKYCEKISEYLDKGFIRKLTQAEVAVQGPRTYYSPHFGVINPNKPEKLRFVMDAAAKSHGVSFNEALLQGPDLTNSLVSVLWKFRQHRVAFAGDIRDMFHRVFIRKEDLPAQRLLWRGMERIKEPDVYEMLVMIFGATCSPSSAQFVKNKIADELKQDYPDAHHAIIKKFYVDDYLDSTTDEEHALKLIKEVIHVLSQGGFELCNFVSNSKKVMSGLSPELHAKDIKLLDLTNDELPVGKVLGLWWNPENDNFTFKINFHKVSKEIITGNKRPTKREVLKLVMSVYDPLGFIGHLIVKSKILLQDVWRCGIGWDDELTSDLNNKWKSWLHELKGITEVQIPRCYSFNIAKSTNVQLHLFCDASEKAFAAIAFLRVESEELVDVSFVSAKTRVAPLKPMSIPRLELQAAVMGSRLATTIKKEIEVKVDETHFWSDSSTVLCWIRNDARRFKQFVSHRLGEIAENSEVSDWHWIPTHLNVADYGTRDSEPSDITPNSRWFKGPDFLREEKSIWPKEKIKQQQLDNESEDMKEKVLVLVTEEMKPEPDVNRYSSYTKLIRATAWIFRFIGNMRNKKRTGNLHSLKAKEKGKVDGLSVLEIRKAEIFWIKRMQSASFTEEMKNLHGGKQLHRKSKLFKLTPFLDEEGVIRVGGRLKNGVGIPQWTKHPVILDPKNPFTKKLVHHYHVIAGHQGRATVSSELRQKYWILDLTAIVKKVANECQVCKIRKAIPIVPEMGNLPKYRMVSRIRPFLNTGLDYFGPVTVTIGRRKEKRWIALFTCLSIRAIHLEIAGSLSTDSAIQAIRRFSSRRGCPANIYSDNGTNFHGANNELKKALMELQQMTIEREMTTRGIQWHFNPPASPHMGGVWERLVGSVKKILGVVLKEREPREETLHTFLLEVENIVNSRPYTEVSVDPDDPVDLTPNHLLFGWCKGKPYDVEKSGLDAESTAINEKPNNPTMGVFEDGDLFLRKQWKISERLADHFWTRWIKEYLPTLSKREKWCSQTKEVKVGDVVIVVDDQQTRNFWMRGKVEAVYPGDDGKVRVVDVKSGGKLYRRHVCKICVLDVLPRVDEDIGISSSGGRMLGDK